MINYAEISNQLFEWLANGKLAKGLKNYWQGLDKIWDKISPYLITDAKETAQKIEEGNKKHTTEYQQEVLKTEIEKILQNPDEELTQLLKSFEQSISKTNTATVSNSTDTIIIQDVIESPISINKNTPPKDSN